MDSRTIIIMNLLIGSVCTIFLFALYESQVDQDARGRKSSRILASSIGTLSIGFAALGSQGIAPALIGVVLPNALIGAGLSMSVVGLRVFADKVSRTIRYSVILFFFVAIQSFFTFIFPSSVVRIVAFSLFSVIAYTDGAIVCFSLRASLSSAIPAVVGIFYFIMAVFFALRMVLAPIIRPENVFDSKLLSVSTALVSAFGFLFVSIGFILLQTLRLKTDLETSERRYRGMVENAVVGIYQSANEGKIVSVNRAFAKMLGYDSPEAVVREVEDVAQDLYARPEERNVIQALIGKKGFVEGLEVEFKRRDDSSLWASVNAVMERGQQGETLVTGTIIDITERKKVEEQLRRAFDEKAVLLRELQHRVKNSISMISSLVTLEAGRSEDPRLVEVLEGLEGRISAFAALYDLLYRTGSAGEVSLDQYLEGVTSALVESYAIKERGIHFESFIDPIEIDAKRAIAIGLMTSELVTDSFKHAFPKGRKGSVRLSIKSEEGTIALSLIDDGIGLPVGFAPGSSEGLGMIIVDMLAAQLGGTLEIGKRAAESGQEPGARFLLRMPTALAV